ncbi:zinc transporter ZIP14-like [Acanthaster planci]|uniref:Zinc transporter ZIP14-like n=1 Tax=Acanthaster planci TaxID=133434 RepID=A0A8B7YLC5_ACAPL|nr:zinc transporter ZIP14-like [Acanthaster planci]
MIWNGGASLWLAVAVTCVLMSNSQASILPGASEMFRAGLSLDLTGGNVRERRPVANESVLMPIIDAFGVSGAMTKEQLQKLMLAINSQCYSVEELLSDHSLTEEDLLNNTAAALQEICPSLLYQTALDECSVTETKATPVDDSDGPTTAQVWGYGVLCVTIINLGSLMGAFVVPCMDKKVYKLILTYLVGLAVGTLTGSALLHLIPKTHVLKVKLVGYELVWKGACILAGIYIFFVAERLLKIFSTWSDLNRGKRQESTAHISDDTKPRCDDYKIISCESDHGVSESASAINETNHIHGHSHGTLARNGKVRIATVAYMIVFGDGLHNFVDGLAIGASFSTSLLSGFSTCIAIACEEFPHELGDFAILLKSGLSVKQAMGFNFTSSLACYVGLIVGITVGRLTSAEPYIFALAAGMFLYIALADMLPEISNVSSKGNFKLSQELGIFVLQSAGMLTGFGIMILLSALHPYIKIKG